MALTATPPTSGDVSPPRVDAAKVRHLAQLLTDLDRILQAGFKSNAGMPAKLTWAQYEALSLIAEAPVGSQGTIAENLGVTGPTMVRIVDGLEKKGLVSRTRDKRDRRIVRVRLTEQGAQVQRECAELQQRRLAALLERVPPATRDTLIDILSTLFNTAGDSTGPRARLPEPAPSKAS